MTRVRVGTDIVSIKKFERSLQRSRWKFERDVFVEGEITDTATAEHLAGIFAAKEAVAKALGLPAGSWQKIHIQYAESGRPRIALAPRLKVTYTSCDLSISHDGDYAIAVAMFLI